MSFKGKLKIDRAMRRNCSIYTMREHTSLMQGFCRETMGIQKSLPSDVARLCILFHDDSIHWTLREDEIESVQKSGDVVVWHDQAACTIDGIPFVTGIQQKNGYLDFFLSTQQLPAEVIGVWVYIVFYCVDAKCETKATRKFTSSNQRQSWSQHCMKMGHYRGFRSFRFLCRATVLHIESRHQSVYSLPFPKIALDESCEYQWNVAGKRLQRLKRAKYGQHFYSPNFNHEAFCIAVSPKGFNTGNQQQLVWQVKLLRLPYKVAKIAVRLQMQCSFLTNEDEYGSVSEYGVRQYVTWRPDVKTLSIESPRSGWSTRKEDTIDSKQLAKRKVVWFMVKIDIESVWAKASGAKVDKKQWGEYDVMLTQK